MPLYITLNRVDGRTNEPVLGDGVTVTATPTSSWSSAVAITPPTAESLGVTPDIFSRTYNKLTLYNTDATTVLVSVGSGAAASNPIFPLAEGQSLTAPIRSVHSIFHKTA